MLYKQGLEDTLGEAYNVTYIAVNNLSEVASSVNSWLYSNPTEEIALIRTYSTSISQEVINTYLSPLSPLEYSETLMEGDTRIGGFCGRIETGNNGDNNGDSNGDNNGNPEGDEENVNSEYQDFVAEYNEEYDTYIGDMSTFVGDLIADILSGAFDGSNNVVNYDFAPGRDRYVTRV